MTPAETLRAAGFNTRTDEDGRIFFLDGNCLCWSTDEALVIAAAERAREMRRAVMDAVTRAIAAQMGSGTWVRADVVESAQIAGNIAEKEYDRRFGAPPADDAAAKAARVEALAATWEAEGKRGMASDVRDALAGKVTP